MQRLFRNFSKVFFNEFVFVTRQLDGISLENQGSFAALVGAGSTSFIRCSGS